MVQLVGKHRIAASDQRLHHAQIGHVAGGKTQRSGLADKFSERLLQSMVCVEVTAYQMRCTGAHAKLLRPLLQGCDYFRVIGEAEIVIAAERQIEFSINFDTHTLRAAQRAAAAQQTLRGASVQFGL